MSTEDATPGEVRSMEGLGLLPLPPPVAWRHSLTHTLHETEDEVQLADADSEAIPLYLHDDVLALRDLADSEGTRAVGYMRRARLAESRNAELELAEEGAKTAFMHVVDQKHETERENTKLRILLDAAYAGIRRLALKA